MSNHSSISRFRPGFIPFLFLLLSLIFLICIGPGSTQGFAAQVTLAWDANTDPGVAGYKLYYGKTSRTYGTPVDVGKVTVFTLTGIEEGKNGYFAVTAYDANRNESAFSTELECFTLVPSQSANGSISPSGPVVVSRGMNQTFTFTPAANYKVSDVTVDGVSVGAITSYTFSNVSANRNIAASFSAVSNTYTISASAGANGSISPSGNVSVTHGGSQAFTITANTGYQVQDVKVDGASVGAVTSYTFSNVTSNRNIAASFSAVSNTYTISASAGANGSISPSGNVSVTHGGSQAFTITANTGYQVQDVKVDGTSVGAVATYTFSNVAAGHSIAASFASFNAAALMELNFDEGSGSKALDSSGSGNPGTISGALYTTDRASGAYALTFDGNDSVTVPAKATLKLSDLSVAFWVKHTSDTSSSYGGIIQGAYGNGYSQGFMVLDYQNKPLGQINFGDAEPVRILGNSFEQDGWTHIVLTYDHQKIRLYQNGGFVSEVPETRNINWDVNASNLTIGLAQWYFKGIIDKVKMYNYAVSSQEIGQLYAEKNAAPVGTYTITATEGSNGAISPSGSVSVNTGASQSFTITPAANYKVSSVTVDGASVGAVTSYTFSNITANHSISASFAIISSTYTISASAGSGGSIYGNVQVQSGNVQVQKGASQVFTIMANKNYKVYRVLIDGKSIGAVTSYTFSNVQANHSISAIFKKDRTQTMLIHHSMEVSSSNPPAGSSLLQQPDAVSSYLLAGSGVLPGSGGWIEVLTSQAGEAALPVHIGWPEYNRLSGEMRVATGDIDGDGRNEIIVGLGRVKEAPGIPGGYFAVLDDTFSVIAWGQVEWPEYNETNGETRPACGDLDGDGIDEIIIGLGPGGEGRMAVFKLVDLQLKHVKWLQTGWQDYNRGNGETRPACGDLDGNGTDEIIVGLGPVKGNPDIPGGAFFIFDQTSAGSADLQDSSQSDASGWGVTSWPDYNRINGEIWPACGDVNGDGRDEIVLGLGKQGEGRFEILGFDLEQNRTQQIAWQQSLLSIGAEVRPACGSLEPDAGDEIVIGFSKGGVGIMEVFGNAAQNFQPLGEVQTQFKSIQKQESPIWPAVFRLRDQ